MSHTEVATSHVVAFSDLASVSVAPAADANDGRMCLIVCDGPRTVYAYCPPEFLDRLVDRSAIALAELRAGRVA